MTSTDSIFFIKETKTCQYVLVIHTPRLCGQPGFKSPREDLQDTPLRCRKVVDTLEGTDPTLPASSHPFQRRAPKPLPAPRSSAASGDKKQSHGKEGTNDAHSHILKALNALLGRQPESGEANGKAQAGSSSDNKPADGNQASGEKKLEQRFVAVSMDEDGEIRIEKFLGGDQVPPRTEQENDDEEESIMEIELAGGEDAARLMKILRDAGYDARLPGQDDSEDEPLETHDEL